MATTIRAMLCAAAILFATTTVAAAGNAADECTANARPSFDCSRAESATERSMCENPDAAIADCVLGRIYQDALSAARKQGRADDILGDQRSWIRDRDALCAQISDTMRASCTISQSEERSWQLIRKFGLVPTTYGFTGSASGTDAPTTGPAEDTSQPDVPATASGPEADNPDVTPGMATDTPPAGEADPAAPAEAITPEPTPATPDAAPITQPDTSGNAGSSLLAAIGLIAIFALLLYFLPTIIAFNRQHPNRWVIFLINFVFGATVIGWVISLIWALRAIHISGNEGRGAGANGGESGLNIFVNDEKTVRLATGAPAAQRKNAVNDLAQAFELMRAGAITQAEFDDLKKAIMGQPKDNARNLQAQLQQLAHLKNTGAISEAEYGALKQKLMSEHQAS